VKRTVRTSEPASEELINAVRWYEGQRPGLGGEFFDAVAEVLTVIERSPEIGSLSRHAPQTRRVLVPRFPYQVVYRLAGAEIVIVAIAHFKRRPGYWRSRS
jgi:toxin ParE1/3/4